MILELSSPSSVAPKRKRFRLYSVLFWLLVIGFSSTTFAGHWADSVFDQITNNSFIHLRHVDPYRRYLVHFMAEKNVHLTMFTVFAILLYQLLGDTKSKTAVVLTFGCCVGIFSEILQSFFPGRDPTVRDAAINLSGTCLGVLICLIANRLRRRVAKRPSTSI